MFPISLKSLTDQERHDYILKTYVLNKAQSAESRKYKRDIDVIKEHHRFLWDSGDDASDSWEKRLARRYYDKLFKEYCIADLTRYKDNKIALRWRIESEVISGKGQFQCGSRKCDAREELKSWEVNFEYKEHDQKKNALVKLRLCPEHSAHLNYTSRKREVKRLKHAEKRQRKEAKRKGRRSKKDEQNVQEEENEQQSDEEDILNAESNSLTKDKSPSGNLESKHEEEAEAEPAENIWSKKLELDSEVHSRENDFERYLEDLLL